MNEAESRGIVEAGTSKAVSQPVPDEAGEGARGPRFCGGPSLLSAVDR